MTITLSYINFWDGSDNDIYFTPFMKENFGNIKIVHFSENPDLLISSVFGNIDKIKSIKAKCKMFYYGENLNYFPQYNNDCILNETFDIIVGFKKTDYSKKQIRFPLWLLYHGYYKWDDNNNILSYIQSKYNENINKEKTLFATLVASHDNGGQRTVIADEVQKYGKIMYPGLFRKNTSVFKICNDKINYVSKGLFNICPENSLYEGYFTEKIFQAFEAGTIPIYWAINNPEPNIINKNKYCFCNIENEDILSENIKDVVENRQKYIDGDLFTPDAKKEIQQFYSSLKQIIESHII